MPAYESTAESEVFQVKMDTTLFILDQGNTYLINRQYNTAIESYTRCIENATNDQSDDTLYSWRAYSHRAECHIQLQNYQQAKLDIEKSHSLFDDESMYMIVKRENVVVSFLRLGKACFELKEYSLALTHLEESKELLAPFRKDDDLVMIRSSIDEYMKKCQDKIASNNAADTISTTTTTTITKETSAIITPNPATTANATTTTTVKKTPTCPKYHYYQNDKFMTIAILEPNLDSSKIEVRFSLDKLTVIVQIRGKQFTVICGTLYNAVIASKCKVKYTDEKVLIKLKKKRQHEWNELFGSGAQSDDEEEDTTDIAAAAATAAVSETSTTSIPTVDKSKLENRPYSSHRDWDAIERNLEREEQNEKPEGEGAFHKFLQDMYKGADEETRRAMIKSYQTSGGTHLVANWDQASKTDYEKNRTGKILGF